MTGNNIKWVTWECNSINRVGGEKERKGKRAGEKERKGKEGYVGMVDKFVLETNVKTCGFKSHYP